MRFTGAGLAIGKDAHVETIHKRLDQGLNLLENHVLSVAVCKNTVELEGIFSFVQDGDSVELIFFVLVVLHYIFNFWVLGIF